MAYFDINRAIQDGANPDEVKAFMAKNGLQPLPASAPTAPAAQMPAPQAPAPPNADADFGHKIVDFGKSLVRPFTESIKTIGTAATVLPQSAISSVVSKFNPQMGAQIASPDILGTQGHAAELQKDPEKSVRQQIGNSLQVASYAVPFGKAGFVGSKFIVPGAVAGGVSAGGRSLAQDKSQVSGEEVLGATAKGAAIGAATGAVMQGLGWVYHKLASGASKAGPGIEKGINNPKIKATTNYSEDVAETNNAIERYLGPGSAEQKLKNSPDAMRNINQTIHQKLQGAADLDTEAIKQSFEGDLTKHSSFTIKDPKLMEAVDQLGKRFESVGASPEGVYSLKSELSNELAPAFKKIASGSPLSPLEEAKISLWGALKDGLDTVSPEIRALNMDQHILGLAPNGLVKSANKAGLSIPIPGTFAKIPLPVPNNAVQSAKSAVGSAAAGVGDLMSRAELPPIGQNIVGQSAVHATTGMGGTDELPNPEGGAALEGGGLGSTLPDVNEGAKGVQTLTGHTPEEIYQALMKAQEAGDRGATTELRQMYNDETAYQKNSGGAGGVMNPHAATAGQFLSDVTTQLVKPDGSIDKGKIFDAQYTPGGNIYGNAINSLIQQLIQSQTTSGRLPTADQVKQFENIYKPKLLDSDQTIKDKLRRMQLALETVRYQKPTADTLPDIAGQ